MNRKHVHFIREILVPGPRGKKVATMQISYSNPTALNPKFQTVPAKYQNEMRLFYQDMGGGRLEEWHVGLTIIIPDEV